MMQGWVAVGVVLPDGFTVCVVVSVVGSTVGVVEDTPAVFSL